MLELTKTELENWRCHFGTSKSDRMGLRYKPMAFTEQGVAMLSGVLKSKRAVEANIAIMRAFVRLRRMIASHEDLARKLGRLEKKYDEQFKVVFDAIHALMEPPATKKKKIGFTVKEKQARYGNKSKRKKN